MRGEKDNTGMEMYLGGELRRALELSTFVGDGESRLSFTKNQWGNYRITKKHDDKAFREVRYCMEIHPKQ